MMQIDAATSFEGDSPVAADGDVLADRRELALVAVERTRMPMVITDPRKPDNPIVLANQAFLDLTGYAASEVLGRNCRFCKDPTPRKPTFSGCATASPAAKITSTSSFLIIARMARPSGIS